MGNWCIHLDMYTQISQKGEIGVIIILVAGRQNKDNDHLTGCANPSMGMSAMIRGHSLNLLPGFELG